MRAADRAAALLAVAAVAAAGAPTAAAQHRAPRSADYLFTATAADARAIWVNPAGLGILWDASVMGEVVIDRLVDGGLALGQYSAGFNSRGLAFGFRHDRLTDTLSHNTFRIGAGRGMGRLAVGGAITFYTNADDPDQRELDVGIRYLLARRLEAGAVARHVGKPLVADSLLVPTLAVGLAWTPLAPLQLAGDAVLADAEIGGIVATYRAGVQLMTRGRLPVSALGVLTLDEDFTALGLTVGFRVGGARQGMLLGTDRLGDGIRRVDAVSLTGVAINEAGGRR